jgi:outer membrane protein
MQKIKSGIAGAVITALTLMLPAISIANAAEAAKTPEKANTAVTMQVVEMSKKPEAPTVFDLASCLSIAEQNNIQLKLSESRKKTAQADAQLARTPLNTRVDFNAGYTNMNPTVQSTLPAIPPASPTVMDITTQNNYKANFTLNKVITTFGRVENKIKAADINAKSKDSDFEFSKSKIRFFVKQNYYYVLSQKGLSDTASENLTLTAEQYDVAKKLNSEGVLPGFDVKQANLKNMVARQSFISQQNKYLKDIASFLNLLGIDSARKDIILAPVAEIMENKKMFEDEQALIAAAFENRDDIKAASLTVDATRKQLASANASANPSVNIMAQYENHTKTAFSTQELWTGMVALQIPILDGGVKSAEVKRATEGLYQAEQQLQQLKDDVKLEVIQALLDYADARSKYETTETEVSVAKENYTIALARYKNGISTNVELDSALNDLNSAKVRRINAVYGLQTAMAKIEYSTGR